MSGGSHNSQKYLPKETNVENVSDKFPKPNFNKKIKCKGEGK